MPANPNRAARGGDVPGTEATDPCYGVTISPLQVSKASYDPGYPLGYVTDADGADFSLADIKRGFASYGRKKIGQS